MMKSKQHQMQAPKAAQCNYCGEWFNNDRRLQNHTDSDQTLCDEPPTKNSFKAALKKSKK